MVHPTLFSQIKILIFYLFVIIFVYDRLIILL